MMFIGLSLGHTSNGCDLTRVVKGYAEIMSPDSSIRKPNVSREPDVPDNERSSPVPITCQP